VNFAEDRSQTTPAIIFATNTGAGTGVDLATSATNAINAATALHGGLFDVAAHFCRPGNSVCVHSLEQPLENPRYDFLVDEDNWA
jgi:hypothetical protein